MSNYIESSIVFGVKLTDESSDKLYTGPKPENLELIPVGSSESDYYGSILGIKLATGFLDEESTMLPIDIIQIQKKIDESKDVIYSNIKELFDKYNIKEDIQLETFLTTYYY